MNPTRYRRAARWLAAATLLLAMAADARAFFFKGWPGDGRAGSRSLLQPQTPGEGEPPAAAEGGPYPGGDTSEPGGGVPVVPAVPEPGAVVLAAVGLGATALAHLWRRAAVGRGRTRPAA
jgi:hypothetical protein